MDIEYHHKMTHLIALRSGFEPKDAEKIAYASQYVDDNTTAYDIVNDKDEVVYQALPTQTMNISKPETDLIRTYCNFHFIPGNPIASDAMRHDGHMHILNTTPAMEEDATARLLLGDALDAGDVYQIGIATHAFGDTFCHQNFAGENDDFNSLSGQYQGKTKWTLVKALGRSLVKRGVPDVGHADAGHNPDIPGLVWSDPRLIEANQQVHNKDRILDAAEQTFRMYRGKLAPKEPAEETQRGVDALRAELSVCIGEEFEGKDSNKEKRLEAYDKALGQHAVAYDEHAWRDAALEIQKRGLSDQSIGIVRDWKIAQDRYSWKEGFIGTNWFKFQEAAKRHDKLANQLNKPRFEQKDSAKA